MRTAQALAVISKVGSALGADIDSDRLARARRRRAPECRNARELADLVIEVGHEQDLSFLLRDPRQPGIGSFASSGAVGLVFIEGQREDELRAHVVRDVADDVIRTIVVENGGETREDRTTLEQLAAKSEVVLIPMAIAPTVSPPRHGTDIEEEAPRGGASYANRSASDQHATHGMQSLSRLVQLLGHERRLIFYTLFYAALAGLFSLTLPLGVQAIVGLVSGGMLFQPVFILIAFVVLGTLANGGLQILQLGIVERIQQRTFARFAFELGALVPRLRMDAVSDVDLPEQMNRFFEIKTIQKSLAKVLTDWTAALLQIVFGIILLIFYHPYFSLFGLLLVASLALFFRLTIRKGLETSLKESKYTYRIAHWLEEMSRNLRVLKFAGRSQLALERMDSEVTGYLTWRRAHFRVLVQQSWAFVAFKTLVTGSVLVLGSFLVVDRAITLGQFVAAELVIVTILLSIEKLILGLADGYDLLTAVEKAGHLTDFEQERGGGIAHPPMGASDPARRGVGITVRDLSFAYQGSQTHVIDRITLEIAAGESVAITGAEGAGESTLLQLLGGLYDDYAGAIVYDGISLRELDRVRTRELVGYCGDTLELFEGTVEENVAIGRPHVRTEDVLEALGAAGLQEWAQLQPNGLQSEIRGQGRAMPAQVAHKLELARALAGHPRLLLLDDFFDNLDPVDKRALLPAIVGPSAPWTVVTVTHDPLVLAACDRIVVLRDGAVACTGPFDELRDNAYFRELATR
ncbi:MAG: ATP-binding cassette domain-containing protein [Gemmatimonadaceae bacterium]